MKVVPWDKRIGVVKKYTAKVERTVSRFRRDFEPDGVRVPVLNEQKKTPIFIHGEIRGIAIVLKDVDKDRLRGRNVCDYSRAIPVRSP